MYKKDERPYIGTTKNEFVLAQSYISIPPENVLRGIGMEIGLRWVNRTGWQQQKVAILKQYD